MSVIINIYEEHCRLQARVEGEIKKDNKCIAFSLISQCPSDTWSLYLWNHEREKGSKFVEISDFPIFRLGAYKNRSVIKWLGEKYSFLSTYYPEFEREI